MGNTEGYGKWKNFKSEIKYVYVHYLHCSFFCLNCGLLAPPWTMSTVDRGSAIAVTPDGLRVQSREQREWHGTRCTRGVRGGKWGFEATVTDEGLCRVGWSTAEANLDLGTDR